MSSLIYFFRRLIFFTFWSFSLQYFAMKKLKTIDLYVYYVPVKNVIVCTDKLIPEDKLVLDEIETKEGFVCLVPKQDTIYTNVNIHLFKTKETSQGKQKNNADIKKKLVNLIIGEKKILTEIDLYNDDYKDTGFEKNVLLKEFDGEILYSIEDPKCLHNSESECFFRNSGERIFLQQYLKLTFSLTFPTPSVFSFIDKVVFPNSCEPECKNGVCYNDECLCELGYIGKDCSIKNKKGQNKKSLIFFICMVLAALILGIIFSSSLFFTCVSISSKEPEIKELDLTEKWEKRIE